MLIIGGKKWRTIGALKKCLKQATQIQTTDLGNEAIEEWFTHARTLMKEVLGEDHELYKRFCRVSFIHLRVYWVGHVVTQAEREEHRRQDAEAANAGLENAMSQLSKCSEYVRKYNIPGEQTKVFSWQLKLVLWLLALILPMFFPEVRYFLGLSSDAQKGAGVERVQGVAPILVTNMYNWYEENNAEYKIEFKRLAEDQARRSVFQSGIAIEEVIQFSEVFRRRRDNKIDSFFAELTALKVNTDTLQISRRLPINLREALKPRLDRMKLDQSVIDGLGLDTL